MKTFNRLCFLLILTVSCGNDIEYPRYSLYTITYIPDSLKIEYREWVKETVRAASQHMTGGDYEDVDKTIRQAKMTADEIFGAEVIGLRKKIDDNYYNDLYLKPEQLTDYEKKVLDSLINKKP